MFSSTVNVWWLYGKRVVAFLPEGVGDSVTEWDVPTCAVPACALFYVVLVKLV